MISPLLRKAPNIQGWGKAPHPCQANWIIPWEFCHWNWGEGANLSLRVKLRMRKSSGFPNKDNTSVGEIVLPQRETERKESVLGFCESLVPAVSEVQRHSCFSQMGRDTSSKLVFLLELAWVSVFYSQEFRFSQGGRQKF